MSFVHNSGYIYVPLLQGMIGPGYPWPTTVNTSDRLPFPGPQASAIQNPVAVRLAEDARMLSIFTAGDIALLDQALRARSSIERGAFYVVKSTNGGIIRRLEASAGAVYLVAEDARQRPLAWERVQLDGRPLSQVIRARAHLVNPVCEWL